MDGLREQVVKTLSSPSKDGFFKGYTIYNPVIDDLVELFTSALKAREDELFAKIQELAPKNGDVLFDSDGQPAAKKRGYVEANKKWRDAINEAFELSQTPQETSND
jgi:hypothetical protein